MKLQDLHPIDSTILGLDNVYHTIGAYGHYINSECILTRHKTITKGKQYIITSTSLQGSDTILDKIRLLDAYYNKGFVYLFVIDLNSERVYIVDLCVECTNKHCTWVPYDLQDYDKLKDYQAVKSYCGKCDDSQKKPAAESNPKLSHDDLLEFEF